MTAVANFVQAMDQQRPDQKVKRDRYGRYLIPHPDTGKEQSWTRATTLANTLADRFGLEQWSKMNVVLGLGLRSDLYAQAAAARPEDKDALNRIVEGAEEAAKSSAGANFGTALHRFVERINTGEDVQAPAPWDRDINAYKTVMAAHGIEPVLGWNERILLLPSLQVAGTCDQLCETDRWPHPRIGDLKTGKDVVRYGMTEIALQLALYAHATHWFNVNTGTTHPIDDKIDQERALVIHLPVEQGRCSIYEVDIAAGWNAVQLAVDVREWRKRKDLAELLVPTGPHTNGLDKDRVTWARDRVQAIKDAGHAAALAAQWSLHPEIPTFPKGGPRTPGELDTVAGMCEQVEKEQGLEFGPSDPTAPPGQLTKRS